MTAQVNFITNISQQSISGGVSGMNSVAFAMLNRVANVNYVGPIDPSCFVVEKLSSKTKRVLGFPGKFYAFSDRRLRRISSEIHIKASKGADIDFFHGFTPWICYESSRPYIAWNDCTFRQYIRVYQSINDFSIADVNRIESTEAVWLRSASHVWFRNDWAAQSAIREYGLIPSRVRVVGNYGLVDPPESDCYDGALRFLFVSTNFMKKGGDIAVKAVGRLSREFPSIRLDVVGEQPPHKLLQSPFVSYHGFLHKNIRKEKQQLERLYAKATALIHPTSADMNPTVIVEAGYHGCPTISTRIHGIPELVVDGESGILLDPPATIENVVSAIRALIDDKTEYACMRAAAWRHCRDNLTQNTLEMKCHKFFSEVSSAVLDK